MSLVEKNKGPGYKTSKYGIYSQKPLIIGTSLTAFLKDADKLLAIQTNQEQFKLL